MSPELIKFIKNNINLNKFNKDWSNIFSIGLIILRSILLLKE